MLDLVLDQPFSNLSEALRTVKVTSDLSEILKAKKVMGVISTLHGEGKSTVSANYAQLIAHAGSRSILIAADLRNPTLSRQLAYDGPGLIDVLAGWKSLDEILLLDPRSGLRFLPAGAKPNMPHTNELLASDAMKKLIALLRRKPMIISSSICRLLSPFRRACVDKFCRCLSLYHRMGCHQGRPRQTHSIERTRNLRAPPWRHTEQSRYVNDWTLPSAIVTTITMGNTDLDMQFRPIRPRVREEYKGGSADFLTSYKGRARICRGLPPK
jgi:hypothetical protein